MPINIAIAEITPAAMHNLLFISEKLNPQSTTETVNPIITITMAKAPKSSIKLTTAAHSMPIIEIAKAAKDAVKHIMGSTSFI